MLVRLLNTRPNFSQQSRRIRVDPLSYESKKADKPEQYGWRAAKNFDEYPSSRPPIKPAACLPACLTVRSLRTSFQPWIDDKQRERERERERGKKPIGVSPSLSLSLSVPLPFSWLLLAVLDDPMTATNID